MAEKSKKVKSAKYASCDWLVVAAWLAESSGEIRHIRA
jgi:predicted Rdx family selenoprotein